MSINIYNNIIYDIIFIDKHKGNNMSSNYFYTQGNGNVVFNATLISLNNETNKDDVNVDEKKHFQNIIIEKNGKKYNLKLEKYNKDFDFLRDEDKSAVIKKLSKIFKNKEVIVNAIQHYDHFAGSLDLANNETYEIGRESINQMIDVEIKKILRSTSIIIRAKIVHVDNVNEILLEYKGNLKKLKLDLLDSTISKLNKNEQENLNDYLQRILPNGMEVELNITGLHNNSWFAQMTSIDKSGERFNVNKEIIKLLDYIPEIKYKSDDFEQFALLSSISDGDTFKIYKNGKRKAVRIRGIDCPEKQQNFGQRAKMELDKLLSNKKIRLIIREIDDYDRYIADVYAIDNKGKELFVNEELVKRGIAHAIHHEFKKTEKIANKEFKGIWVATPNYPELPSTFREKLKKKLKK